VAISQLVTAKPRIDLYLALNHSRHRRNSGAGETPRFSVMSEAFFQAPIEP
jgi:hypothetical protein